MCHSSGVNVGYLPLQNYKYISTYNYNIPVNALIRLSKLHPDPYKDPTDKKIQIQLCKFRNKMKGKGVTYLLQ